MINATEPQMPFQTESVNIMKQQGKDLWMLSITLGSELADGKSEKCGTGPKTELPQK